MSEAAPFGAASLFILSDFVLDKRFYQHVERMLEWYHIAP